MGFVELAAVVLTAANDAEPLQVSKQRRDDRPLTVSVAVVAVDDHPVIRHTKFMSSGRVRVQRRVVPIVSSGMQNGQPGLVSGIETAGAIRVS